MKIVKAINTEDWWAVWLGAIIITVAITGFAGRLPKTGTWIVNPLSAFQKYVRSVPLETKPADLYLQGEAAGDLEYDAGRKLLIYQGLMTAGRCNELQQLSADPRYKAAIDGLYSSKPLSQGNNLLGLLVLMLILGILISIGGRAMGVEVLTYLNGYAVVFVLAIVSHLFAEQYLIDACGLGYAFWALALGLLISSTIGTPDWLLAGARTGLYFKIGLVLLGAEILLNEIPALGLRGLPACWPTAIVVIMLMYVFGTKYLKMAGKRLVLIIGATTALCGVPAAIAAAATCRAKKEELAVAVGIVLIGTVPLFILIPLGIKFAGLDAVIGGAWLGAAIGAPAAFLGPQAGQTSTAVIMIKNVLIGMTALFLAVYSTVKVNRDLAPARPGAMEVWHQFPKYMLGLIGASLLFSFVLIPAMGPHVVQNKIIAAATRTMREWLFCLGFVSVGLQANLRDLKGQISGGKSIWLYIVGQSFNLALTFLAAWVAFGG